MKWLLIWWMIANAALIAVGLVIVNGPGPADHRVGGAFPVVVGSVSAVAWLAALLIWLIVVA